ncbi:MAG: hypothetical protein QW393_02515 [Candidatus Micrarchaeaceae archaeon]
MSGISISYKTIEKLYSDKEALIALSNLRVVMLRRKDVVNSSASSDDIGYSPTIRKHYKTSAQKPKN